MELNGGDPVSATRNGAGRASGAAAFAVDVHRRDGASIVQPRGELDLATATALRAALAGIPSAERLVVDLRGLSFIDSTGLDLLVTLHQRAQRDGFELTLLPPGAPVHKAIQLCGLDRVLPFQSPEAGGWM
jgi:anti-anti-sigma factor